MSRQSNFRLIAPALACAGLIISLAAHAGSGTWTSNGPFGGNVSRLISWEPSPTTLWAIGRGGVFRSVSGGSAWERISTGVPDGAFPEGLAASTTASPVLYLTANDRVYRSGDGGNLWVPTSAPCVSTYLGDVALRRGSTTEIAVMVDNGVCVSNTGGASWLPVFAPGSGFGIFSLAYSSAGVVYASGGDDTGARLYKSAGGVGWTAAATPAGFGSVLGIFVAPGNANRLYALDYNKLATSADAGATWNAVALPATCTLASLGSSNVGLAIATSSDAAVWVGCREGVVKTTNATVASPVWTSLAAAAGLTTNGIDGVSVRTLALRADYPATPSVWIGTQDAGLFATSNDGTTWTAINQNFASLNIRAIAPHPRDTVASVVLAGQGDSSSPGRPLWISPNGTGTWSSSMNGLNAEQLRALAIDATTTDNSTLTSELFTVYGVGRSENFTTPGDGGIYKSIDAGANWATIDNGIPFDTGSPSRRTMGTVRALALDPRSCVSPPPTGPCPSGVAHLQTLYVGGSGRQNLAAGTYLAARIYKSTNAGTSWTASDTGMPARQDLGPPGAGNYAYQGGIVQIVIDPATPTTLYASAFLGWGGDGFGLVEPTVPNGVFKSTNGGVNWVHSSVGLPRLRSAGSSQYDVLALAIDPAHPQVLYAGASNLFSASGSNIGSVYKSIDGAASWSEVGTGIAGQDVRALVLDPTDASGDTVYAGTGGSSANPGGVYRTTDGGTTWNSFSLGLPASSSTSLALLPRAIGDAPHILAGTPAGVWDYTFVSDEDSDGAPSAVENGVNGGDGNGDGMPDATQPGVASTSGPASRYGEAIDSPGGTSVAITTSIVAGSCTRLNDTSNLQSGLFPPDPLGSPTSHDPWGLLHVALPACASVKLRVTFHGATFDNQWTWRNYGPRIPGNDGSFGWYSFAGAKRIDAQTWELDIAANRQGNYRNDATNILFIGGPGLLPDLIFDHGFE